MRKFALAAAASVFGLALAAPAFAQDGPPPAPSSSDRDTTFTGARAGVLLGYDQTQPGSGPGSNIGSSRNAHG